MDRRSFVAMVKRLEVGERVVVDRPTNWCRQALTVIHQVLDRSYRTNMLATGAWRIERKK